MRFPLPLSRRASAILALVSAAILFVCSNAIVERVLTTLRLDLTAEHLYTLSSGTRATLARVDEKITLRFYYSPRLGDEVPSYGIYAQRVRATLEEYAALSHGKIELLVLDPQPFSATEDRAVAFGLQGVPIDAGGEQVYFGLAGTNSTDDQQTIPFFQPEREHFLDYDLTKLIHSLAVPKKTVVGLVTALPLEGDVMAAMQGQPMQPYVVIDQLQQLDDVQGLGTDFDQVPKEIDVLMIVHPQHLPEKTLMAIDRFVSGGGRALVFVDPHSETQAAHPSRANPPGSPDDSTLDPLFTAWGLTMEQKMVAGDRGAARRVNAGTGGRVIPIDYVAWLALTEKNINRDDPITANLTKLNLASAGILKPLEHATTHFTPLLTTTADSEEIPVEKLRGLPDVAGLLRGFKSEDRPLVLAAHITGPARAAYPDKDAADATHPVDIVVVADTDLLDDRFWAQTEDFFGQRVARATAGNGDFVANAVEVLAGGGDLLDLRSRGSAARPFELVEALQRRADQRYEASEKELREKLKDTEAKMKEARGAPAAGDASLSVEQMQALDNFRAEMLSIRRQLREVQLALRQDITWLKNLLEFLDIALVPILVGIVAVILSGFRGWRRRRRVEARR